MDVNREFYHFVCRNTFVLIFWMRHACVWKVERRVQFLGGHGRERRVYNSVEFAYRLQQTVGMHHVRLLLDVSEILCLCLLAVETLLVAVQYYVNVGNASRYVFLPAEIHCLRNVAYVINA